MAFEGLSSGGIKTAEQKIRVIGNNVSNVDSIGYKSSRADATEGFNNVLRYASASLGGTNPGSNTSVIQIGTGTQLDSITTDFSKGQAQVTGRQTDLYIGGIGFFNVIDTVTGNSFATRQGNFRIDDRSYLVTQNGYRVQAYIKANAALPTYSANIVNGELVYNQVAATNLNAQGTITDIQTSRQYSVQGGTLVNNTGGAINPATGAAYTDADIEAQAPKVDTFSIDQNGNITLSMTDGKAIVVGTVLLMKFSDPQALIREGSGLYSSFDPAGLQPFDHTNSVPGTNGLGKLQSGALELSNVDLTQEFSNMIIAQRSFQASARVITTADEIYGELVNLKR